MKKKMILLPFLLATMVACNQATFNDISQASVGAKAVTRLTFSSRDDLERAIDNSKVSDSHGNILHSSIQSNTTQQLRSLDGTVTEVSLSSLVPEEGLRKLLNPDGEIQVSDTIYRINGHGTFYAHVSNAKTLEQVANQYQIGDGAQVEDKLLDLGSGVYLYQTFADAIFDEAVDTEDLSTNKDDPEQEIRTSNWKEELRALDIPNLGSFKPVNARRQTFFGKLLQGTVIRNSFTATLPGNSKRRINCAVFDYNYLFRHSIGVTAKIQKKMWHGSWGQLKYVGAREILVGYRYALVKYPYPKAFPSFEQLTQGYPSSRFEPTINFGKKETSEQIRFAQNLPYPSWFNKSLFRVTVPIIEAKVDIKAKDVLSLAYDRVKQFMKSYSNSILNDLNNKIGAKPATEEDINQFLAKTRLEEFVPACVPIYAKDGIYVMYTAGWMLNKEDQTEITLRFSEGIANVVFNFSTNPSTWQFNLNNMRPTVSGGFQYNNGMPGFSINKFGFNNPHLGIVVQADMPAADLIEGDFFAIANNGGWAGFNLNW